ncbi:MAG: bifunctional folylpolyglutamate synthase/dihydrofolate synthase [Ruminococcaceae bacterium]|nr:bifunctional folylpolyglutamate synthase/dihydrofolate synthase [Oscillospiraceae bacterium]
MISEAVLNYTEALEYIHGVNWTFCKPGLERIGELCGSIGHPERNLRFIHVAGTNGKGSTSVMLAGILQKAGYKVGLYTSPYIKEFNERMRIDGKNISDRELAEITEYIRPMADAMQDKPTEFELITAIAFEYFWRNRCDVVVLEAGMGGRLDSTNIIEHSLLSVITGIALDHVAFLGDTVEKIAAEKAGIIKRGCPVIFGGTDESAATVIERRAQELGSPFYRVDYNALTVNEMSLDGTELTFDRYKNIHISLLGSYQPRNAALVLSTIDILRSQGIDISENAVREGLRAAKWSARFEIISQAPLVIFDGAHNAEGIAAAVESIKLYFKDEKVYVLTGVLKDKDYGAIAKDIASVASKAFTMTPDNPRALSAKEYADVLSKCGVDANAYGDIDQALSAALESAKKDGKALFCLGSLYTYSSIISRFE